MAGTPRGSAPDRARRPRGGDPTGAPASGRGPPAGASEEFVDLVTRMLEKDPSRRIGWAELRAHPFWEGAGLGAVPDPGAPAGALPAEPAFEAMLETLSATGARCGGYPRAGTGADDGSAGSGEDALATTGGGGNLPGEASDDALAPRSTFGGAVDAAKLSRAARRNARGDRRAAASAGRARRRSAGGTRGVRRGTHARSL